MPQDWGTPSPATPNDWGTPAPAESAAPTWQENVRDLLTTPVTSAVQTIGSPAAMAIDAARGNNPLKGQMQSNQDLWNEAKADFQKGNHVNGVIHALDYLANAIPGLGTTLRQSEEDFKNGRWGQAFGVPAGQAVAASVSARAPELGNAVISDRQAGRAARLNGQAISDFIKAVPPSSSAPYTVDDLSRAQPYLQAEHGDAPIESVTSLRDAADTAVTKIENHVKAAIEAFPDQTIDTSPLAKAKAALEKNPRGEAVTAGLKELSDLPLDKPLTLADADRIRQQLNAENKAILKKNNYDVSTARQVDPGFAAREAAAQSLREGIYTKLDQLGVKDVADLRRDEGAVIQVRNAAQRQMYNGEKNVAGTVTVPQRLAAEATRYGSIGTGAYLGGPVGAVGGAAVGSELARRIASPLTRDDLVARIFQQLSPTNPPQYPMIPSH